jgi:hypothetical protein
MDYFRRRSVVPLLVLLFGVVSVLLFRASRADASAACIGVISFGEPIECAIETGAEVHRYTLTGFAEDRIRIKAVRTAGTLQPHLRLVQSNGAMVCDTFTSDAVADLAGCLLPRDDTYTVQIADTFQEESGSYNLFVQRLNDPGNARALFPELLLADDLRLLGEEDAYTVTTLAAGDVHVTMRRTAGDMRPRLRIYDRAGSNLCSAVSSATLTGLHCSLPGPGRYTLLADDLGTRLGAYTLALECPPSACALFAPSTYLPLVVDVQ